MKETKKERHLFVFFDAINPMEIEVDLEKFKAAIGSSKWGDDAVTPQK